MVCGEKLIVSEGKYPDPFIQIKLINYMGKIYQKKSTKTLENTYNPVWNQTLSISIPIEYEKELIRGTAEIEKQPMSWSDLLNEDLSTPNNHPGWMHED